MDSDTAPYDDPALPSDTESLPDIKPVLNDDPVLPSDIESIPDIKPVLNDDPALPSDTESLPDIKPVLNDEDDPLADDPALPSDTVSLPDIKPVLNDENDPLADDPALPPDTVSLPDIKPVLNDEDDPLADDPGLPSDTVSLPDIKPVLNDEDDPLADDPALPSDTVSLPDIEPVLNDNLGTNLDSSDTRISSKNEEPMRCVNCGVNVMHRRRHTLELLEILSVIRQWTAPQVVTAQSLVCHSCWTSALHNSPEQVNVPSSSSGQRRQLCVKCKCSIRRTRSHILNTNSERETHIRNVISDWIAPQKVQDSDRICHPCWQRADRVPVPAPPASTVPTIKLPNYTRAPDTAANCFCPGCESPQRLVVPKWLRMKLFMEFNFYVPKNCRICRLHLQQDNWDELLSTFLTPCHLFTVEHIQDFASFRK